MKLSKILFPFSSKKKGGAIQIVLHIAIYTSLLWIVFQYSKNYSVETFATPNFPFISLVQEAGQNGILAVNYVNVNSVYIYAKVNNIQINGVYKVYEFNNYILGNLVPINLDLVKKVTFGVFNQIILSRTTATTFYAPNGITSYSGYPTESTMGKSMVSGLSVDTIETNLTGCKLKVVIDLKNKVILPPADLTKSFGLQGSLAPSATWSTCGAPDTPPQLLTYDPVVRAAEEAAAAARAGGTTTPSTPGTPGTPGTSVVATATTDKPWWMFC